MSGGRLSPRPPPPPTQVVRVCASRAAAGFAVLRSRATQPSAVFVFAPLPAPARASAIHRPCPPTTGPARGFQIVQERVFEKLTPSSAGACVPPVATLPAGTGQPLGKPRATWAPPRTSQVSRGLHGSLSDSGATIRPGPHTPRLRACGLSITRALWKLGASTLVAVKGQRLRPASLQKPRSGPPRQDPPTCTAMARAGPVRPLKGAPLASSQDPPARRVLRTLRAAPCGRRARLRPRRQPPEKKTPTHPGHQLRSWPAATTPPTCRLAWRLRRRHQTAGKTRTRSDDQPDENDRRKHPPAEESGLRKPNPTHLPAPTTLPPLAAVFECHQRRRMARHEADS